jgi:hypothetical protein
MPDNNVRTKGRGQAYKFDRGGMPTEFGPFIGVVKNNVDPTRSGRLQVYIEQFAGDDPTDSSLWRTVSYIPPFYGVTPRNNSSGSSGDGSFKGNQQSYGMWFTPPDLDVKVICFFVAGDPNQGYYIGCVPDPGVTHMIPAIGSSLKFETQNADQKSQADFSGTKQLPVVEVNSENEAIYNNPRFFALSKPVHSYQFSILANQGLLSDYIRGPISSSAQRESPSSVFGMITPGRPIYQGGLTDRDIKQKLDSGSLKIDDIRVEGRRGGHSIVMDDGDLRGRDNLIRIRTAKGHQITMSDEADCFYFIHANGQTWIELGTEGTVDVYSTNSVNVRTQGQINLHSDKDININAGETLRIRAKNIQTESQETTKISSAKDMTVYCKTAIGVLGDGSITLNSGKGGWKTSGGLTFLASRIDLNGFTSPDSVVAPKPIEEFKLDDTSLEPGKGWKVDKAALSTIVTRAPTHEPYPYHNRGVPVQVNLVAPPPAPPSAAVTAAVANTQNIPVAQPSSVVPNQTAAVPGTGVVPVSLPSVPGVPAIPGVPAVPAIPSVPGVNAPLPVPTLPGAVSAVGIDAAAVLKTPVAGVSIGNLDSSKVTALMAQAKTSVGQAADSFSLDKGIGQYGLKPEQLESAGFLKPGVVQQLRGQYDEYGQLVPLTPDEVEAVLKDPTNWTGKSGVSNLDSMLKNPAVQDTVQIASLETAYKGLQSAGVFSGSEQTQDVAGLLQAANKFGVNQVNNLVKGVADPSIAASLQATIRGAQFSSTFVDTKLGEVNALVRTAEASVNTVDRTALDATVSSALGDPKIPAPEFKPQEREPDTPTVESELETRLDEIIREAAEFIDSVKAKMDVLIAQSQELDRQQPLSAAQIDAFAQAREEYRSLWNNTWNPVYVNVKLAELDGAKFDPIRPLVNNAFTSINRLVQLLASISKAQRELIEQWRANAGIST